MPEFTVSKAMHGVLYKRYHLKEGRMVAVGDCKGTYGPEDRATGAEYKCLQQGERNGRPIISRDWEAGPLYPATVFIWGQDDKGNPLPHEKVEEFAKRLGFTEHKRVILPNGWAKGVWTWDYALCFVPPERAPIWYGMEGLLKARFSQAQIDNWGNYFTLYLD